MKYENMRLEIKDQIAVITINHPPANTWNLVTMESFENVLDAVENDSDVRVVILTGAGEKFFSAGFDVRDAANTEKISPKGRELWRRLDRFAKPVIAAINGYALGGGLELSLACHFRFMADVPQAEIGLTELNLGIIPGWGGTQRLPRIVGRSKAMEMILFSHRIKAKEALKIGLIDRLMPPEKLQSEALAFATKLAQRPPVAVRCVLNAFTANLYEGLEAGLEVEAQGSAIVRETEDRNEGFTAFLEKRQPCFKGR
jgi:enoyl-CoA hydratase/carnithine racemase